MVTAQEIAAKIAAELRLHPENWMKGGLASTQRGMPSDCRFYTEATDPLAVSWCLHGLIRRELQMPRGYPTPRDIIAVFESKCDYLPTMDPDATRFVAWNDLPQTTVEDVIAFCDKVAAS